MASNAHVQVNIWPAFNIKDPAPFFIGMAKTFNCWVSFGVPNPFAVAMTTMADMEAAFKISALGDHGTAYGLYQEHIDRASRIKDKLGIDLTATPSPSLQDQCKAAWWELNNTETKARDAMLLAQTGGGCSAIATALFERAGEKTAVARRTLEGERITVFISNNFDWVRQQG